MKKGDVPSLGAMLWASLYLAGLATEDYADLPPAQKKRYQKAARMFKNAIIPKATPAGGGRPRRGMPCDGGGDSPPDSP